MLIVYVLYCCCFDSYCFSLMGIMHTKDGGFYSWMWMFWNLIIHLHAYSTHTMIQFHVNLCNYVWSTYVHIQDIPVLLGSKIILHLVVFLVLSPPSTFHFQIDSWVVSAVKWSMSEIHKLSRICLCFIQIFCLEPRNEPIPSDSSNWQTSISIL